MRHKSIQSKTLQSDNHINNEKIPASVTQGIQLTYWFVGSPDSQKQQIYQGHLRLNMKYFFQ